MNELAKTNGGGGSVSKYAPRYFKIDWDKASEDWELVLSLDGNLDNIGLIISSSNKINFSSFIGIVNYPMAKEHAKLIIAFSYLPISVNLSSSGIPLTGITDFNTLVELLPIFLKNLGVNDINLTMEGITEITEDEYYKID